ncbi:MAG: hypothetical protein AAF458_10695 [Pseudomonadota bacterium]
MSAVAGDGKPNRNPAEMAVIEQVAGTADDGPVLMLNLNRYSQAAGFPDGQLYRDYMRVLNALLPKVGGRILWQYPVRGQPLGDQPVDEVLGVWYPSHQAFLDLPSADGADENYRLREQAVADATIHRCPGETPPFGPT